MNYARSCRGAALAPPSALFAECLASAVAVGVNTSLHERRPRKINASAKTAARTPWTLNEPRRARSVPTARDRNINNHYFSSGHKFLSCTGGLAGGIPFLSSGVLLRNAADKLRNDSPQASPCDAEQPNIRKCGSSFLWFCLNYHSNRLKRRHEGRGAPNFTLL